MHGSYISVTSLYLFGKGEPALQVHAEGTVSLLLIRRRRAQAIFLNASDPRGRSARPAAAASEHLTHGLVVEVHVEVGGHLSPFSQVQQSQRHEEGFDLVGSVNKLNLKKLQSEK